MLEITMPEILYRGQTRRYGEVRVDGEKLPGNWVYGGGAFSGTGDFSIIYGWESDVEQTGENLEEYSVYSDTVDLYINWTDMNGVKIFTRDIVRVVFHGGEHIFVVVWDPEELDFKVTNGKENYGPDGFEYIPCCDEIEVIGNVHDNPEFLEGGKLR